MDELMEDTSELASLLIVQPSSSTRMKLSSSSSKLVGQTLFIMEVMKMEVPYEAPAAGKIAALHVAEGDVLEEGHLFEKNPTINLPAMKPIHKQ